MKKLIFSLIIGIVLLSSCEKKCQETVSIWNGQNTFLRWKEYPVSIIWFRESARNLWIPNKGFNQASEIKSIINLLDAPEVNNPRPELRTRNKLSLIYYLGKPALLTVVELYFDINDGVFVGPKGESQELGKLLVAKEESGLARYRFHMPPYNEEFIDKVEKSLAGLRKQVEQLKAKKGAEAHKKIEEANQPK